MTSGINRELARLSWWQVRHSSRVWLLLLVAAVPTLVTVSV